MSRTYRGIFEKSVDDVESILSDLTNRLEDAHRIITTIRNDDVSEDTISKIDDVEYILGDLINELE